MNLVPRRLCDDDAVAVQKVLLKAAIDSVERASKATAHAGKIASGARDAFEEENRRLAETARDLQSLLNRL